MSDCSWVTIMKDDNERRLQKTITKINPGRWAEKLRRVAT